MSCDVKRAGDVTMIVCGSRRKATAVFCVACLSTGTKRAAPYLCDGPRLDGRPGTCSKGACHEHARETGPNTHACRDHAAAAPGPDQGVRA